MKNENVENNFFKVKPMRSAPVCIVKHSAISHITLQLIRKQISLTPEVNMCVIKINPNFKKFINLISEK